MATIIVNPGDSIQTAINGAQDFDTILVNPGTYTRAGAGASVITINKPLTVRSSEGPEVTIIDGNSATENYYVVDIASDNVTLEGFTITNPLYNDTADASGIVTSVTGAFPYSNITIRNNIVTQIGLPTRNPVSFGSFGMNVGPVSNLTIEGNEIFNIAHSDPTQRANGIFVYGNSPTELAENVTIQDNLIYNIQTPNENSTAIAIGGDTTDIFILNNRIETPDGAQMLMVQQTAANVKRGITTSSEVLGRVEISGNTIRGATEYGMRLASPAAQVVTRNTLIDNAIGIYIAATAVVPPEIHYNTFTANGTALVNDSDVTVDAQYNFWGSAAGPTPGVDIIGPANYTPYLQVPPGQAFVTTGPIANRPAAARPTRQLYVVIENTNDTTATIQIQGYYLTNTQNLYALEQLNLAPEFSPGSKVSRTYFANFDEFEFRFIPSNDRVLISVWGLDANGQLVGPHRLVNSELSRIEGDV
ncbi:right-handed parallel beta-helix repeat-containing protein [Lysinibacillus sphaericus]